MNERKGSTQTKEEESRIKNKKERKMGGHGGLNILSQKKCNVSNFDNREVQKDKE